MKVTSLWRSKFGIELSFLMVFLLDTIYEYDNFCLSIELYFFILTNKLIRSIAVGKQILYLKLTSSWKKECQRHHLYITPYIWSYPYVLSASELHKLTFLTPYQDALEAVCPVFKWHWGKCWGKWFSISETVWCL